jgi:hypothetical protein
MTFTDTLGWTGVILFMLAYGLVSFAIVKPTKLPYQTMNLVGAALVGTQAYLLRNAPVMTMELFWGAIGIAALIKILRNRSDPQDIHVSPKVFWHMFYCMLVEICKDHERLTVEVRDEMIVVKYDGAEAHHIVLRDDGIDYGDGVITFAELENAYDRIKEEIETTVEYFQSPRGLQRAQKVRCSPPFPRPCLLIPQQDERAGSSFL